MIELRDRTRIFGSHWQRMSVFLFPHVLTLFIYSMCRTDKGYLIHPCIHLYVKSDGFFFVTSIWGLLEVNIAELRVTENHLKKKKEQMRKSFPSWATCRIDAQDPSSPACKYLPVIYTCLSWVRKYMANAEERRFICFTELFSIKWVFFKSLPCAR